MLTAKEQTDVRYWNTMDNSLTICYMFLWIPLSFAFYAKYKQDRIKNAMYSSRIITIHLVQLPFLIYVKS